VIPEAKLLSFVGPAPDDADVLAALAPLAPDYLALLRETNGFIAFGGGLHVRGASRDPAWHALREAWLGSAALHVAYPALSPSDVPFAQDALGDQYVLRERTVWHLAAETGELEPRGCDLATFLDEATADPIAYLGLDPLLQFEREGGRLAPGQLLSAYPPFCTAESAEGVALQAVGAADRLAFLAALAAHVATLGDRASGDTSE
jgi:hypothetical protein